jgi:hypothetical protein
MLSFLRHSLLLGLVALVAPSASVGCMAAESESDDDGEEWIDEAGATLKKATTFSFSSRDWDATIQVPGEAPRPLGPCALDRASSYGLPEGTFLVCHDGSVELIAVVPEIGFTGTFTARARDLGLARNTGLRCTITPEADRYRRFTCVMGVRAPASLKPFDSVSEERLRNGTYLPGVARATQPHLVDDALARLGTTRLSGIMSTADRHCTIELTKGAAGALGAVLYQDRADGTRRKLMQFDAAADSVLGASVTADHVAMQTFIVNADRTYDKDYKLIVSRSDADGLRAEIVYGDYGAAYGNYCRKLQPAN